jgi:hypothetical protein
MQRLKLMLPDPPDDNLAIDVVPVVIGAYDAVLGVLEIATGIEFAAFGFATSIVAAVVGQWAAIGSGYAEARDAIKADRMAMGYSYGLVTACDGKRGHWVSHNFGEQRAEFGYDFVNGNALATRSFNAGLVTGYWQGVELSAVQRRMIWRDLLTRTGKIGTMQKETMDSWGHTEWVSWYREIGIAWRRYHMK